MPFVLMAVEDCIGIVEMDVTAAYCSLPSLEVAHRVTYLVLEHGYELASSHNISAQLAPLIE